MSKPFNQKEWALVTQVMDTVDQMRAASPDPVDGERVKALVLKTYSEQGIAVDEGLVNHALALALEAFPVAPTQAPVALGPWWEQSLDQDTDDMPMDKAQRLATVLLNHALQTQAQIQATAEGAYDSVLFEHAQTSCRSSRRVWGLAALGVAGTAFSIALFRAMPFVAIPLLWGSMMITALPRINSKYLKASYLLTERNQAAESAKSLRKMDTDNYALKSILGKCLTGVKPYDARVLSDEHDRREWVWANDAARQDALLAKVWRQWLESARPIRKGDVDLLRTTAEAIRQAKAWMALHDAPLSLQHGMRQQLLKNLDS